MRKKIRLSFILTVLSMVLFGQETKLVSLDELLASVEENNLSIKLSQANYDSAKGEFVQSNAAIFPKISISHTGLNTNNPLMTFGSKLNQEIVTQSDFSPSLLNNPESIDNFSTKIELVQPIFNADGLHMRKAAKAKMNALEMQSSRTKDAMTLEITKAYMQLQVAYKVVEVLEKSVQAASESLKSANDYFEQGYLQKSDLLSVEVFQIGIKNKLQNAHAQLHNTSDYIHHLTGKPSNIVLKPIEALTKLESPIIQHKALNLARNDIKALEKNLEAFEHMYKAARKSYLPRFNAFGSYELHDSTIFSGSAKGYIVGAQLSWNVFEGFQRIGKIHKSKADFNSAALQLEQYKNESKLTLEKTRRQLLAAENSLRLTELAVDQSKEALRIRGNRFREGLEKTADLITAESTYLNKQLEAYQALFNYNFTKAYLTFLSN